MTIPSYCLKQESKHSTKQHIFINLHYIMHCSDMFQIMNSDSSKYYVFISLTHNWTKQNKK